MGGMATKPKPKHPPGHADPEEYQRFLEAARLAEASDDPKDFDKAFMKVAAAKEPKAPS
jgi:hypothetical protein